MEGEDFQSCQDPLSSQSEDIAGSMKCANEDQQPKQDADILPVIDVDQTKSSLSAENVPGINAYVVSLLVLLLYVLLAALFFIRANKGVSKN